MSVISDATSSREYDLFTFDELKQKLMESTENQTTKTIVTTIFEQIDLKKHLKLGKSLIEAEKKNKDTITSAEDILKEVFENFKEYLSRFQYQKEMLINDFDMTRCIEELDRDIFNLTQQINNDELILSTVIHKIDSDERAYRVHEYVEEKMTELLQDSTDEYSDIQDSIFHSEVVKRVNNYLQKKREHDERRESSIGGEEKKESANVSFVAANNNDDDDNSSNYSNSIDKEELFEMYSKKVDSEFREKLENEAMKEVSKIAGAFAKDYRDLEARKAQARSRLVQLRMKKENSSVTSMLVTRMKQNFEDCVLVLRETLLELKTPTTSIFQASVKMVDGSTAIDPITNKNFAAIFKKLSDMYENGSFKVNFKRLTSIFNKKFQQGEIDRDPSVLLRFSQGVLSDWNKTGFFKKITEDMMLTIIMVNAAENSQLQGKLVTKIMETLTIQKNHPELLPQGEHPVFEVCSDLLINQKAAKDWRTAKVPGGPRRDHTNNAAKANNGDDTVTAYLSIAGGNDKLLTAQIQPDREVRKDENFKVINPKNGFKYNYVAVTKADDVCKACYGSDPTVQKCAKKCYNLQCKKCLKYGHGISVCMNQKTSGSNEF